MSQKLSSIFVDWDSRGVLSHEIKGGYSNSFDNERLILAPSLPMIVSHQLGTYSPTNGLNLCSSVFDFYICRKNLRQTIISALRNVRIDFIRRKDNSVSITFHPRARIFSRGDCIEKGSLQFLNNYLGYVSNLLQSPTDLIIQGLLGSAINMYIQVLIEELRLGRINPQELKWNPNITRSMAVQTSVIAELYGPEYSEDTEIEKAKENIDQKYGELKVQFNRLCEDLGLTN
jgi:hypothetical protein